MGINRPIVDVDEGVNAISANEDFMRSKDIHPICKRLVETTIITSMQHKQMKSPWHWQMKP